MNDLQPLFGTLRNSADPEVFTAIETLVRDGEDRHLCRINVLAFAAKLVFELTTGSAVFVDGSDGFTPVPLAHAAGALIGAAVGLTRWRKSRKPAANSWSSVSAITSSAL